ncbi:MAG: Na+/H+ antiporter subunit G, partial [Rhodobacterales bacterium 17-64-5]
MSLAVEILISALLIIGGSFGLIGSFGLLKLRDPMQRLHAPTKATTVGVGASLIAAAATMVWQTGTASWQGVMVAA